MSRTVRFLALALPLSLFALFPGSARANLQFDLNGVINGVAPVGSTPWATAVFHTNSPGDVTLTLNNLMPASEFIDTWLFNVNVNATTLTPTQVSGPSYSLTLSSTQNLDGGSNVKAGWFNVQFSWPIANGVNRFSGGRTVVVQFTGGTITENSFNLMSLPDTIPPPGFETDLTAAHVQGIPVAGTANTASGSIRGTIAPVPETSSILMLLSVGVLLAPALRSRLHRQ